jgi:hypothetical protein
MLTKQSVITRKWCRIWQYRQWFEYPSDYGHLPPVSRNSPYILPTESLRYIIARKARLLCGA